MKTKLNLKKDTVKAMKVKTNTKAGARHNTDDCWYNHNQALKTKLNLKKDTVKSLKVKSDVKAGAGERSRTCE